MKKMIAGLAAAASLAGGTLIGAGTADAATVLNVRTQAGTGYAVVGQLVNPNCNALVRPIQRKNVGGQNWNKVRATNGKVGWAVNGGRYVTWCH